MRTVIEIAKLAQISVRTLHHYDAIGLLKPTQITEAGYRLYDDEALERLYLILLFRELEFPLNEIREILDAPDFDRNRVLEQQVELLKAKVVDPKDFITHTFPLEKIEEFFCKQRDDISDVIKMVMVKES